MSLAGRLHDKVDNPYSVTLLLGHLCLSCMWFGVAPRTMSLKEVELHAPKYDNHSMLNKQHT